jgi:hypothetical protein
VRFFPGHIQSDALGDGHRQCSLDGFFAASGQGQHGMLQQ